MKDRLKLPVDSPIVASNTEHGYLLSGIQTNKEATRWIMANYINQVCYITRTGLDMNFYPLMNHSLCPCIDYQRISKTLISSKWEDLLEFLFDCINSSYYIMIYLDWFYIPTSRVYGERHLNHPTLVYGYDHTERIFNVADFNKNFKFSFTELSYDIIKKAIVSQTEKMPFMNERYFGSEDAILYKNREDYLFDIDKSILKQKFEYYLYSENLSELYNQQDIFYFKNSNAIFGIDSLTKICDYLLNKLEYDNINYKLFTVPKERTELMLKRLDYLNNIFEKDALVTLNEKFLNIFNQYKYILNLSIKFNIYNDNGNGRKDNEIINNIVDRIEQVKDVEKDTFSLLINSMRF
ncbi:MAG: hypothetical protein ACERKN_19255 [Velocimicrobium sp.]